MQRSLSSACGCGTAMIAIAPRSDMVRLPASVAPGMRAIASAIAMPSRPGCVCAIKVEPESRILGARVAARDPAAGRGRARWELKIAICDDITRFATLPTAQVSAHRHPPLRANFDWAPAEAAPGAKTRLLVAAQVLAALGIDRDRVAFVDEVRYLHHQPGLGGGGLKRIGHRRAAHPGLGAHHLHVHRLGQPDV